MDVPSPAAGVVKEMKLKVGDKVSEGTLVLTLEQAARRGAQPSRCAGKPRLAASAPSPTAPAAAPSPQPSPASGRGSDAARRTCRRTRNCALLPPLSPRERRPGVRELPVDHAAFTAAHASPSVRKFARELGVDLAKVTGHRAERAHPAGGRAGLREAGR